MAELQWAVTCRDVVIAKSNNAVTYRDTVERMLADSYPLPVSSAFVVATLWRRSEKDTPESIRMRVVAETDDGELLGETEPISIDLRGYDRYRVNISNPDMEVPEPGMVKLLIQEETDDGWTTSKMLPVDFELVTAVGEPAAATEAEQQDV